MRTMTFRGAIASDCGAKSNCAPPVDSPHITSQQIIAAIAPVGDFPSLQQAFLWHLPGFFIEQLDSLDWLMALLMTSMPHMIPPAIAWPAKNRTNISAATRFSITPRKYTR